jgi:hypothetical protein
MAPKGTCHLCGAFGVLSFEHVPPRAAFNSRPLVATALDELLGAEDPSSVKGRVFQRGAGAYTLCVRCNSKTGRWYGPSYVDWVYQGMNILTSAGKAPSLYYNFHVLPLRVLKQIACMFFSVNPNTLHKAQPELQRFILDRRKRYLPENLKIFTFYAVGNRARQSSVMGRLDIKGGHDNSTFTEICFPPFGYALTFDRPPHPRMLDISYFGRYGIDQFISMPLRLPVLPVINYMPGDYRTQGEIDVAREANRTPSSAID